MSSTAIVYIQHAFSALSDTTLQLFFRFWEQEEVAGRDVWRIRWVRQQLHLALIEKVDHCYCYVRTGILMMKKMSSVAKRNGGDMARFSEETGIFFVLRGLLRFGSGDECLHWNRVQAVG